MSKQRFFLVLALAISLHAWAEDFSIHIVSSPKEIPQGAPINLTYEVCNTSGHAITVARGYGGFECAIAVRRADGMQRKGCKQPMAASYLLGFTSEVLPADWKQTRTEDITCDDVPGEWIVQAKISCKGPYLIYGAGQKTGQVAAWSGHVASEEVHIHILRPDGIDLEAYNAFHGCPRCDNAKLLEQFPTSTYAGYVLAHHGPALALQSLASLDDVDQTLRQFGDRGGSEENTQAHVKEMQDTMRQYVVQAGPFLKAHPDFFYAPLIRRMYAMCLGLTGHLPEAMAEIQTLSTGTGKEADEAKAYLAAKANK